MSPFRASSPLWTEALAVLGYGALSLLVTWPLVLHLNDQVVGNAGSTDYIGHLWHCKWFATALFDGYNPYQVHTVLYPAGSTDLVIKSGPCVNAIATVPFQCVLPVVTSYNLTVLGLMMFTGYGGYRLALELTHDKAASFVAGAVLTMNPMMLSEMSEGHMDQFSGGWCLLTLAFMLRTVRGQGRWAPVLAGVFFAMTTLSYLGFGLLMTLWLPVMVIWMVLAERSLLQWALVRRLVVAGAVVGVLLSPVILAYGMHEGSSEASGVVDVAFPVFDARDRLGTPSMTERIILTESVRPLGTGLGLLSDDHGPLREIQLLVLCLVVAGLVLQRKRAMMWLFGAALFGVLSLGPYLGAGGDPETTSVHVPLPALLLYNHFPFYTRFRFPSRTLIILWMCLVPIVGLGIRALTTKLGLSRRLQVAAAAGLCILLCVETFSRSLLPFPASLNAFPETPRFYSEFLVHEPAGAILNIPFALAKPTMEEELAFPVPFWQALEMHHHTTHGKAILSGMWVAFSSPPTHREFVQHNTLLNNIWGWQNEGQTSAVELADLWVLEQLGFDYAVVNKSWLWPETGSAIQHYLTQLYGPPIPGSGGELTVFDLENQGAMRQGRQRWETVVLHPRDGVAPDPPPDPRDDPETAQLYDRIAERPQDLDAHLQLVDRLEALGAFGLALDVLDAAERAAPLDARVHHRRGDLCYHRGISALALDSYEEALRLDPTLDIDLDPLRLPAVRRR